MSGLLGGVFDFLFGAPESTSEAMSKEDIAWLMDKGLQANRVDKNGLFGGWNWDADKTTQTETVNPALIPGIEKLMGTISGDQQPYESPQQFNVLLDSMMANKMRQYGNDPSGYAPTQSSYAPPQRVPYEPPQASRSAAPDREEWDSRIGQYDPRYANRRRP